MAVTSLALGSASLILLLLTAIPAIITGCLSLRRIKRSSGKLTGRGLALGGLALGCLGALETGLIVMILRALNQTADSESAPFINTLF